MLFRDGDCRSDMGRFLSPTSSTEKAYYTRAEMYEHNIKNDDVGSVMVPFGYSVDLFRDDGFAGDKKTVQGPVFNDSHLSLACINVSDFNDRTSSVAVYKNTVLGASNGYWTSITATESLKFRTHYGLSYSQSESTSESA